MHAQTTTTPAQANEATPDLALKVLAVGVAGLRPISPGLAAAIDAVHAFDRDVWEPASKAQAEAERAVATAEAALARGGKFQEVIAAGDDLAALEATEAKAEAAYNQARDQRDTLVRGILSAAQNTSADLDAMTEAYGRLVCSRHPSGAPELIGDIEDMALLMQRLRSVASMLGMAPVMPDPAGEVARLYPEWLAAAAADDDEGRFRKLEEQIEAMPCRTAGDAIAKLKVLLDVYEDGAMVMDPDHVVEQLKDAIAALDADARRNQLASVGGVWDAAVAQYHQAKAANEAFCAQSDEVQDEQEEIGNEIFQAYSDAVYELEKTEPPTTTDLALVIRAQIELSGLDYAYQSIDCPNTFSDFLASQDDTVASRARAYLSLLRAVGSDNPALGATLWDRFPAEEYGPFKVEERRAGWLAHHERRRAAAFAGQPAANLIAAE